MDPAHLLPSIVEPDVEGVDRSPSSSPAADHSTDHQQSTSRRPYSATTIAQPSVPSPFLTPQQQRHVTGATLVSPAATAASATTTTRPPLSTQASTVTVDLGSSPGATRKDQSVAERRLVIAEEEEPDAVTFSKNKEVAVAGLPRLVHADMFVTTVEGERDAASVSPQDVDALARLLPPHSASSRSTTRVVMYWVDVQKRHSAQALLEDPTLLSTLITTGSWHALAELTRHRLLHTPPTSTAHIFELWYHRIIALTKHRSTFAQARAETRRLMAVLGDGVAETAEETRKQQQSARPTTTLPRVPFALRVVMALVPWIAGGAALETVEMLYRLLYLCRVEYQMGGAHEWIARELQLLLLITNCLIGAKDTVSARAVLSALAQRDPTNAALLSGMGRLYLQLGDVAQAETVFQRVEAVAGGTDPDLVLLNRALLAMSVDNYAAAATILTTILAHNPQNTVVRNNLALCAFYQGRLKEAITGMESAIYESKSTLNLEPLVFNLCTLYESSEPTVERKRHLVGELARRAGDNFDVSCLKL